MHMGRGDSRCKGGEARACGWCAGGIAKRPPEKTGLRMESDLPRSPVPSSRAAGEPRPVFQPIAAHVLGREAHLHAGADLTSVYCQGSSIRGGEVCVGQKQVRLLR